MVLKLKREIGMSWVDFWVAFCWLVWQHLVLVEMRWVVLELKGEIEMSWVVQRSLQRLESWKDPWDLPFRRVTINGTLGRILLRGISSASPSVPPLNWPHLDFTENSSFRSETMLLERRSRLE